MIYSVPAAARHQAGKGRGVEGKEEERKERCEGRGRWLPVVEGDPAVRDSEWSGKRRQREVERTREGWNYCKS